MRVGLHALGIGTGARPEIIRAVAVAAETRGFATLWSGEHVVLVDEPGSWYPYAADGRISVPADADWLDPFMALSYIAAVTSRIGLATGVLLLPEHNPVLAVKQAAALDVLSGGGWHPGAASRARRSRPVRAGGGSAARRPCPGHRMGGGPGRPLMPDRRQRAGQLLPGRQCRKAR